MGRVKERIKGEHIQMGGRDYMMSYNPETGELELISPGAGKPSGKGGTTDPNKEEEKGELHSDAMKAIRLSIERLLKQNRLGGGYTSGHTKGKLDMHVRSLVRGAMGSKAIRKKKDEPMMGYNFLFLVDTSGSMDGDKMRLTNQVLQSLMPALDIDGVSTAVLSFSSKVIWKKDWHETKLPPMNAGGGNSDFEALKYSFLEGFKDAPKNRKNVLIMLSDGSPCDGKISVFKNGKFLDYESGYGTDDIEEISNMVRVRSSRANIATYGIGVLEGGQQIPKHSVISRLSELQPLMEKVVRQLI